MPDLAGGYVLDRPSGIFSLYLTNTVDYDNLHVTSIDKGDSEGGAILDKTKRGFGSWPLLGSHEGYYAPGPIKV